MKLYLQNNEIILYIYLVDKKSKKLVLLIIIKINEKYVIKNYATDKK